MNYHLSDEVLKRMEHLSAPLLLEASPTKKDLMLHEAHPQLNNRLVSAAKAVLPKILTTLRPIFTPEFLNKASHHLAKVFHKCRCPLRTRSQCNNVSCEKNGK
jgi:hypothetical protein